MVNFHGKYALPLEHYARSILSFPTRAEAKAHFADADAIESGSFVKVMQAIIHNKYGDGSVFDDFCSETEKYYGIPGLQLSEETAERLFSLFKSLM